MTPVRGPAGAFRLVVQAPRPHGIERGRDACTTSRRDAAVDYFPAFSSPSSSGWIPSHAVSRAFL